MPKAPCKDCTRRKLYCHSSCKEYLEFKKAQEKIRKAKIEELELKCAIFDSRRSRMYR